MKNLSKLLGIVFLTAITFAFLSCEQPANSKPKAVVKPTATPAGGNYTSAQTVTLTTATEGAAIRYTLDGTTPTTTSTLYSSAITISETKTLKAIAVKSGMTNSEILTETYTLPEKVAQPTATPAGGNYTTAQTVTLATATTGASIRYTLNGTTPTASSTLYSSAITISATTTLKAIAIKAGIANSDILTETYTITLDQVIRPTATPAGGNYTTAQTVRLTTATTGATIRYTLDGTDPTTSSSLYLLSISIRETTTIKAIAIKAGMANSEILTETYTITSPIPTNYTVTFSINGGSGTVPTAQTVNAGSSITLPDGSGLTRSGYTFGGWNTNLSGTGTNYAAGSSYTVTGTTFLYAKWVEGSGTHEVTIAMWDNYGNGWNNNAALRINVNGTDFSTNARLASGGGPDYYTFFIDTDDTVQIYWVSGGTYDYECAFAVYYSNDPPNPAFNPSTGTSNSTRILLSKQYNDSFGAVGNGTAMGSFTVGTATPPTKAIRSFRFADFSVNGTIDETNISVTVPNIVNLTTLVPTIVHNGKSISPESGEPQNFSSPIQYTVTAEDDTTLTYTVTVQVANIYLATALTWINNYSGSTRTFTIVAQANETIAPTTIYPNYSNANIILSGGTTEKTISLYNNNKGSLFSISNGTLTLDNNITLQGHSSNNASLVRLSNTNAKLVMNDGSKINNNTTIVDYNTNSQNAIGGGVYVGTGTFTMNGGTISGNRVEATDSGSSSYSSNIRAMGGGVYVGGGTFIMNNGTISNNTAYSEKFSVAGGGVSMNGGTFTLVDGTISNNTADSRAVMADSYVYGGGVAVWTNGTFTMQGGTISGNQAVSSTGILASAYYYGGGVYVRNNQFRKTGGTIYGSNGTTAQQNLAKYRDNSSIGTTSGHAVYALVGSSDMKRNTTAGTAVNLDSSSGGSAGGWE